MGTETRQVILDTAKRLFTERGYNAVSMGDIAQEVGISKGNLTYHFKKKELLIEALLDQNSPNYDWVVPTTLAQLNDYFRHEAMVIEDNAFYFWHHAQLAQLSERIQERQAGMFTHNRIFLGDALDSLMKQGLIAQIETSTAETLSNALLMTVIYWLPFEKLSGSHSISLLQQMWSLLLPYLTQKGREEYEALNLSILDAST